MHDRLLIAVVSNRWNSPTEVRLDRQCRIFKDAESCLASLENGSFGCVLLDLESFPTFASVSPLLIRRCRVPVIAYGRPPQAIQTRVGVRLFAQVEAPAGSDELRKLIEQAVRYQKHARDAAAEAPILLPSEVEKVELGCQKTYDIGYRDLIQTGGGVCAGFLLDHSETRIAGDSPTVVVLAGHGRTGAMALSAARHLKCRGVDVRVITTRPFEEMSSLAAFEASRCELLDVSVRVGVRPREAPDIILDGLLGAGGRGALREPHRALVEWANAAGSLRVACDVPSGLDPDNGLPTETTFRAALTLCMGLPMRGVLASTAAEYVGRPFAANTGAPMRAYQDQAIRAPHDLFRYASIVPLRTTASSRAASA